MHTTYSKDLRDEDRIGSGINWQWKGSTWNRYMHRRALLVQFEQWYTNSLTTIKVWQTTHWRLWYDFFFDLLLHTLNLTFCARFCSCLLLPHSIASCFPGWQCATSLAKCTFPQYRDTRIMSIFLQKFTCCKSHSAPLHLPFVSIVNN